PAPQLSGARRLPGDVRADGLASGHAVRRADVLRPVARDAGRQRGGGQGAAGRPGWGRSVRRVREVPLRIPGVPAPDGPAGAAGERIRPDPAAARPVRAGHPTFVLLSAPPPTTAAERGRSPAGVA